MTPTPSLQRRVTLVVLALLTVLLVVLGVTIDVTMGVLARRNLHDRLLAATSRADALSARPRRARRRAQRRRDPRGPRDQPRPGRGAGRTAPAVPAAVTAAGLPAAVPTALSAPARPAAGYDCDGRRAPVARRRAADPGRRHHANHSGHPATAGSDDRRRHRDPADRGAAVDRGQPGGPAPAGPAHRAGQRHHHRGPRPPVAPAPRRHRIRPRRKRFRHDAGRPGDVGTPGPTGRPGRPARRDGDPALPRRRRPRAAHPDRRHDSRTAPPNTPTTGNTVGRACCSPTRAAPGDSSTTCWT